MGFISHFKKFTIDFSSIITVLENGLLLSREKLINFNWTDVSLIHLETDLMFELPVFPGKDLLKFPTLVKDLDGIGYGLEALLN